ATHVREPRDRPLRAGLLSRAEDRCYALFCSCSAFLSIFRMAWSFAGTVKGMTPGTSHSVHILSTSAWKCSTSSSMKWAKRPWRFRYSYTGLRFLLPLGENVVTAPYGVWLESWMSVFA